jgi:hypothetical protein
VGRAASASIRPLTIPTALMPGKAHPPHRPVHAGCLRTAHEVSLARTPLPTPALIGAAETVSRCLLCSRTAASLIPPPFGRDPGAAKYRRTHTRKHGERSFCVSQKHKTSATITPCFIPSVSSLEPGTSQMAMTFLPTEAKCIAPASQFGSPRRLGSATVPRSQTYSPLSRAYGREKGPPPHPGDQ